jgi:hypothetical protein
MRWNSELGFLRISITTLRYFDRGAGSFMGGGAWITEAHVQCAAFPLDIANTTSLPNTSVAGWVMSYAEGEPPTLSLFSTERQMAADNFSRKFWTLSEALDYANGEMNGDLTKQTCPVSVRNVKGEVRIHIEKYISPNEYSGT